MNIDVSKHLGAMTRTVTSREHEGKPARVIKAERLYETTVEDAWDALTSRERIPRWFLPISGELKLGGRFQFEGNAGGKILRCDAPNHLAVTWEMGGDVSWVDVRLSAKGKERTLLTLEHVAYVDDERWNQFGPGAVGVGWELGLTGMALHFASGGKPVDPGVFMAWSAGPDGKAFITKSSEGWAEASIAGGTEASAARAAGKRTTGFYTGESGA